jgi:hypothetical protein
VGNALVVAPAIAEFGIKFVAACSTSSPAFVILGVLTAKE